MDEITTKDSIETQIRHISNIENKITATANVKLVNEELAKQMAEIETQESLVI